MIRPRKKPRKGRVIDRAYMAWVRTLPCVCCEIRSRILGVGVEPCVIEAAHIGIRGLGQKCSDRETAPLCAHHHRTGSASHHRLGKHFWDAWKLDKAELIKSLNLRYEAERLAA